MKKIAGLLDGWIFFPAIPYFIVLSENAPNIPIWDDYDAILWFINSWKQAGWLQRCSLLFMQHNEHRILHSRIVYVLYYYIFGNINFRNLIFCADVQLLVIAGISAYFIWQCAGKYWKLIACIWMFFLFDLNSYEAGSVAMYGMQTYGVIMLFFLGLYLYSKKGNGWLIPAALIEMLCIFSSGNGMIGAFFIAMYTLRLENKWKKITAIAILAACIPLYFLHYTTTTQPNKLPFSIEMVVVYFIRMTGAPIQFSKDLTLGILVLAGIGTTLFFLPLKSRKTLWPLLCILGFVLSSMGTIALFRACFKDAQYQTSRYLIYPAMLLAILLLFIWQKAGDKKYKWVVIAFFTVGTFKIYSDNFIKGKAGFERTTYRAEMMPYYYPDIKRARMIITDACQLDIYCLEQER